MNQSSICQDSTCTAVQEMLEVYLANELDTATHTKIAAHVASCPRCQDEVRLAEAINTALKDLPRPEPPPQIFNTVAAYVSAHPDNKRSWTHRVFRFLAFWDNLAAPLIRGGVLACLAGIFLFGIYQYQQHVKIAQATRDLNYAFSKLHYAVERIDLVIDEKLPDVQINAASRRSFVMIEDASRRVFKQQTNISSAIHRSLDSLNQFPNIISDTKYHKYLHQKGGTP